jgi:uncharacterized sporulation protein YeaH/YhbH (DUF444 family)
MNEMLFQSYFVLLNYHFGQYEQVDIVFIMQKLMISL